MMEYLEYLNLTNPLGVLEFLGGTLGLYVFVSSLLTRAAKQAVSYVSVAASLYEAIDRNFNVSDDNASLDKAIRTALEVLGDGEVSSDEVEAIATTYLAQFDISAYLRNRV